MTDLGNIIKLRVRTWDDDPWCLNGWPGCHNITGGHYCRRGYQHAGRCVCGSCGATTTRPAPEYVPEGIND